MGEVLVPLLALAVAASGCGSQAPPPPVPTCLDRLSDFRSCSGKPSGKWTLIDTCNDAPPPFNDVRGCEGVSWIGDKQTRHLDGSMLCTGTGSCSSDTSISGESTMVLSEGCLFGIASAFHLASDLPPWVCDAVEISLVQALGPSTCTWDARSCTCLINQRLKVSESWLAGEGGLVSREDASHVQDLCVRDGVLAVESTQGYVGGPDVHTIWVYEQPGPSE